MCVVLFLTSEGSRGLHTPETVAKQLVGLQPRSRLARDLTGRIYNVYTFLMKTMRERIKLRMRKDRPMTVISMRMPEDVLDELKEIAPLLGYSGYQPLMRAYIGQGLRKDLSDLLSTPIEKIAESLRKQGVEEDVIAAAIADWQTTPVQSSDLALAETR
jgi:hypothetical protein